MYEYIGYYWCSLVVAILGIIGNILMLVVFLKPILRKHSVSIYFCAMSVSNLVINFNGIIQFMQVIFKINLFVQSQFTCKTLHFALFIAAPLSAWFLVAAGIDRYLTIFYSNRVTLIKKARFSLGVVFFILTVNIAIYFHLFFNLYLSTNLDEDGNHFCIGNFSSEFNVIDLVNSTLLPFIMMLATSVLNLVSVYKSRKRMKSSMNKSTQRRVLKRDIRFGVSIVVLNIFFFLCNMPDPLLKFVHYLIPDFVIINFYTTFIIQLIYFFLYNLFYSVTFYQQLLTNSLVRKQFFKIFTKSR